MACNQVSKLNLNKLVSCKAGKLSLVAYFADGLMNIISVCCLFTVFKTACNLKKQ